MLSRFSAYINIHNLNKISPNASMRANREVLYVQSRPLGHDRHVKYNIFINVTISKMKHKSVYHAEIMLWN